MAREFSRTQRVADFLKRELAGLIQFELGDPRIGMVSITDVEVSRDLAYARVFVTVLGKDSEAEAAEALAALNHAAGHLRTRVAKVLQARTTPKLRFFYDGSVARGAQMSELIDQVMAADRQRAADEAERDREQDENPASGDDAEDRSRDS